MILLHLQSTTELQVQECRSSVGQPIEFKYNGKQDLVIFQIVFFAPY